MIPEACRLTIWGAKGESAGKLTWGAGQSCEVTPRKSKEAKYYQDAYQIAVFGEEERLQQERAESAPSSV